MRSIAVFIVSGAIGLMTGCQAPSDDGGEPGSVEPAETAEPQALSQCGPTPRAPACNLPRCTADGWDFYALDKGTPCRLAGGASGICDGGGGGDGFGRCIARQFGSIVPDFMVTHVVYAVPGKSSSVQYTAGNSFATTTSTTRSFKNDVKVTVGGKGGAIVAGGEFSVSGGRAATSSRADATEISSEISRGYRKPGQADLVNHDDDEIWFVIKPQFDVVITPPIGSEPRQVEWSLSPNQPEARHYYAYVRDLKNPEMMPASTRNFLDAHGITPDRYPELLKADPFAHGEAPLDPARFVPVANWPYMPPNEPGHSSNAQMVSISRKMNSTVELKDEVSYSVGVKVKGDVGFLSFMNASLTVEANLTWSHSSSNKEVMGASSSEVATIGQPAFGYEGPGLVRIYEDRLWKTYLFRLEYQ
jgi:hypothetical protein